MTSLSADNKKKRDTNELVCKRETDPQTLENEHMVASRGKDEGKG